MGRKPIAEIAKRAQLRILLTESELSQLTSAATAEGKPTSTWARDELLRLANEVKPATSKKSTRKLK